MLIDPIELDRIFASNIVRKENVWTKSTHIYQHIRSEVLKMFK